MEEDQEEEEEEYRIIHTTYRICDRHQRGLIVDYLLNFY